MSLITRMRRQTAVWWQRSAAPDRYGKFTFADPVEIDCRWDDSTVEFLRPDGEKAASRAVVYVDRIMSPGDRLLRGVLESDMTNDAMSYTDAFEIMRFDQNPNIRATETLLTAYL